MIQEKAVALLPIPATNAIRGDKQQTDEAKAATNPVNAELLTNFFFIF